MSRMSDSALPIAPQIITTNLHNDKQLDEIGVRLISTSTRSPRRLSGVSHGRLMAIQLDNSTVIPRYRNNNNVYSVRYESTNHIFSVLNKL